MALLQLVGDGREGGWWDLEVIQWKKYEMWSYYLSVHIPGHESPTMLASRAKPAWRLLSLCLRAFGKHGTVVRCSVPVEDDGWNKGMGIIEMTERSEALRGIASLHGRVLNERFGGNLYVMDEAVVFSALWRHSENTANIGASECYICTRACPTKISKCTYLRACMKCATKYDSCPICDAKYDASVLNFKVVARVPAIRRHPLVLGLEPSVDMFEE